MEPATQLDVPRADWAYQYLEDLRSTGQPMARRSRTLSALCVQKSMVYRQSLDTMPETLRSIVLGCDLPQEVSSLIEVPSVSAWVPETHAHAYFLTIAQLCQPSEEAFLDAAYKAAMKIYQSDQQRLLLLAISPTMVMRGGQRVWQQMHRGTELIVESTGDTTAYLRLGHPPSHLNSTLARMYGVSFAASLHSAGAVDAEVVVDSCGEQETVWHARWG